MPTASSYYSTLLNNGAGTKSAVSVTVVKGGVYIVVRMGAAFGSGSNRWSKASFSGGTINKDFGILGYGSVSYRAMIVTATGTTLSYSGVTSEDTESHVLIAIRVA